jgi:sortase A
MRGAVRGLGELFITAGAVLLLFVAYQLVWTNYEAQKRSDAVTGDVREAWERPPTHATGVPAIQVRKGKGFAFLHIPKLGRTWQSPVIEGVSLPDLAKGVGHYPRTALPGQVGNFAVAGHRATNGEPFAYLDRLHKGDVVVAETRTSWYTYVVDRVRIVQPTSVWVLDPVPGHPGQAPTEKLLTLTTCNPRWASYQRLIVFGHLEETRPHDAGPPAVLGQKGAKA